MSILTNDFPTYIEVCGTKCKINTDFKVWLKFANLMSNTEQKTEDIVEIFKLIFCELPPNFNDAIVGMINFYSGNANIQKEDKNKHSESKIIFDFTFDADMIFSAFMQQYKIDLTTAEMHWWKFKALFSGLSDETQFIKAVQYRGMDLSKIKDKDQKKFYHKMKKIYKLPDRRREEEKENDFINSFEKLFEE